MIKLAKLIFGVVAATTTTAGLYAVDDNSGVTGASMSPFFARYERSGNADFTDPLPASVEASFVRHGDTTRVQVEMRMVTGKGEYLIDRFLIDPAGLHTVARIFSRSGSGAEFDTSIEDCSIRQTFRRGTAATSDNRSETRRNTLSTSVFDPGLAPFVVAAKGMKTGDSYPLDILYSGFNQKTPAVVPATVTVGAVRPYDMPDGSKRDAYDVTIEFVFPSGRKQARSYVLSNEAPYQLAAKAGQHWRLSAFK